MKPDRLGEEKHPMEFAVIDGIAPYVKIDDAPVVFGTMDSTDEQVLDWLRAHSQGLGPMSIANLVMPNTTKTVLTVLRFRRCPECREWSPCLARRERGY